MDDQNPPASDVALANGVTEEEWGEYGRRILFLNRVELFSQCSSDMLAHLAAALRPVSVTEGSTVIRAGDPGDAMYFIREGTVAITTHVGDDVVELARLGPGHFFGEQALLTHGDRSATVRTVTPVSLWALPVEDFDELVQREPQLAAGISEVVAMRTRENVRTIFDVERHNVAALTTDKSSITLGRAPDNDVVFDSHHVSLHHAVVEQVDGKYRIRDLQSANGTSVNGVRTTSADLSDGDEIRLADQRFFFDRRQITRLVEPKGVAIALTNVTREVKGGKKLLDDVSLSILPGEFVAIVGGSGAGKTMLMSAMSGLHPATSGRVEYNGRDYYSNLDLYRNVLGYVPQDDIIHTSLPVRRTLYHAARLRLPPDTSHEELNQKVNEAMDELSLQAQADIRVGQLSGGQRKRSSLGVELLTRPRVFYLDEPTSGLDPATETQMMQLMRGLADDGATVLVTTHATKNVMMCDKVVFLARGGHLAFAGSPRRALTYFGAQDFDEIYQRLERDASPAEWAQRFRDSHDFRVMLAQRIEPAADQPSALLEGQAGTVAIPPSRHPKHQVHQFAVLTQRSFEMLVRYPANLFALFIQPILITVLLLALFQPGAFTPGEANPIPAVQTLLVICFAIFFFGISFGLNEICKEFVIFSRERMVNLGVIPYVLSKVAVLGPFLLLAELMILVVLRAANRLPSDGFSTYGALFLTLALSELAGLAIGLLASSAVPDPDAATRLLPAILLPQALFCGGFVARPSMALVGQWISNLTVMRWSFEATGRNLNVNALANPASPLGNPVLRQYGDAFSRDPWQNWVILSAFLVLSLVSTCVVLSRRRVR